MEQKSKLLKLDLKDIIKSIVMAGLFSAATVINTYIEVGNLHFDWGEIGKAALIGALAYIVKNFLTNSDDKILIKEKNG